MKRFFRRNAVTTLVEVEEDKKAELNLLENSSNCLPPIEHKKLGQSFLEVRQTKGRTSLGFKGKPWVVVFTIPQTYTMFAIDGVFSIRVILSILH